MPMQDTTVTAAHAAFLSRCVAKDLTPGTIGWYGGILNEFARFLRGRQIESIRDILPSHARDFLSGLRQASSSRRKGQSSVTVFGTWGALKCCFRFWNREGLIPSNPMTLVERPRRERRIIRTLNMAQVRDLLAQPDLSTVQGRRDLAMILLMLDSGLRIAEILTLEAARVYLEERLATVMGKGRKERMVPIGAKTCEALREYIRSRDPVDTSHFFSGRGGRPLKTRGNIETILKRYGKAAGITGVRLSPHTLRHTFAVQYIKNGGDPFSLQEILGHTTLEMVRLYVNLARQDVAEQHRKFSPMDRLLGPGPQPPAQ